MFISKNPFLLYYIDGLGTFLRMGSLHLTSSASSAPINPFIGLLPPLVKPRLADSKKKRRSLGIIVQMSPTSLLVFYRY